MFLTDKMRTSLETRRAHRAYSVHTHTSPRFVLFSSLLMHLSKSAAIDVSSG